MAGDRVKQQERERTSNRERCTEQGPGHFPAQAASDGWLRGWLPAFVSELPSSVRSAVVPDTLAVLPLGGQDGGQHLEVAQPCLKFWFNASFCP